MPESPASPHIVTRIRAAFEIPFGIGCASKQPHTERPSNRSCTSSTPSRPGSKASKTSPRERKKWNSVGSPVGRNAKSVWSIDHVRRRWVHIVVKTQRLLAYKRQHHSISIRTQVFWSTVEPSSASCATALSIAPPERRTNRSTHCARLFGSPDGFRVRLCALTCSIALALASRFASSRASSKTWIFAPLRAEHSDSRVRQRTNSLGRDRVSTATSRMAPGDSYDCTRQHPHA